MAVGTEVLHPPPRSARALMPVYDSTVVHDDDVIRPQLRHEHLGDIGFGQVSVDRTIHYHRRDHTGHAKACHQRGRFRVAMREAHAQALALGAER